MAAVVAAEASDLRHGKPRIDRQELEHGTVAVERVACRQVEERPVGAEGDGRGFRAAVSMTPTLATSWSVTASRATKPAPTPAALELPPPLSPLFR